jgi:hypothetical protein
MAITKEDLLKALAGRYPKTLFIEAYCIEKGKDEVNTIGFLTSLSIMEPEMLETLYKYVVNKKLDEFKTGSVKVYSKEGVLISIT